MAAHLILGDEILIMKGTYRDDCNDRRLVGL